LPASTTADEETRSSSDRCDVEERGGARRATAPAALLHGVKERSLILAHPLKIRRRCLHPEIRIFCPSCSRLASPPRDGAPPLLSLSLSLAYPQWHDGGNIDEDALAYRRFARSRRWVPNGCSSLQRRAEMFLFLGLDNAGKDEDS
ncbi:unnamed protein product, partial [Urochloa humidicola]